MNRDQRSKIIPNRGIMSDPDEPWSHEQEEQEARRQHSYLRVLTALPVLVAGALIVVGGLLYFGWELPPNGMNVQPSDSTGYQPPPRPLFGVEGTVPRTGVERVLPDLPDGRIPPQAAALTSPLPTETAVLQRGAVAYANNCAFCHGTTGKGDGPVSEHYVPGAPALATARVRGQAPGVLFYQVTNGILSTPNPDTERLLPREWHAFKGTMTEEDRWAVVAFMKSLGTGSAVTPPSPEQTTFPKKTKDVMPGTTNITGEPGTDPARAGGTPGARNARGRTGGAQHGESAGVAPLPRGENATLGR